MNNESRVIYLYTRKLLYKHFISVFDLKITFVNSQHKKTNSKGDFILKNRFETFVLKISGIQKKTASIFLPSLGVTLKEIL